MPTRSTTDADQEAFYTQQAQKYLASLPLEHFMESVAQSTQRQITVASLQLVAAQRPDFHLFSELLVQWRISRRHRNLGKIVPDNMVVLHDGELAVDTNYTLGPARPTPFWVFEYISASSERKDYGSSLGVYEQSLEIPYYLTFHPDGVGLTLFRRNRRGRYQRVRADGEGRRSVDEVDIRAGMLDGWVRYWFLDELLPLPAELQSDLRRTREQLAQEQARRAEAEAQRDAAEQRALALEAELARLLAKQKQSPE